MADDDKPAGNPQFSTRVPSEEIFAKLMRDAKKKKLTIQAVIWGIVGEHYGVEVATPQRGRPKSAEE